MKNILFLIITLTFLSSCVTQKILIDPSLDKDSTAHFIQKDHFFINGIGQTQVKNAKRACKNYGGVAAVESKYSFVDGLIGAATYGIYTPRTRKIYCKKD
jgi:hypothetical protein